MRRLLVLLPLLIALVVTTPAVHATVSRGTTTYWDLSIKGKQTVTWDYGTSTHDCEINFRGEDAKGGGTATISFASSGSVTRVGVTRNRGGTPIVSLGENDGPVPATWSKQASGSNVYAEPCPGDADADVAPIPLIQKTDGCGTRKTKLGLEFALKGARLQVGGGLDPDPGDGSNCLSAPGFGYRKEAEPCTASHNPSWPLLAERIDGSGLVRFLVKLDRTRLAAQKPKTFQEDGNVGSDCKLEAYGTGGGTVKVRIDYTLTFKPRPAKSGRRSRRGH
ncbi:hypothetical protein AB0L40_08115 [Patulibacter sp. NPDC049589]|uniref:hypothetical protein n=1 Tax=Patulibacter sp. NPDC049589 TaxID=3154731 RepID=UPI003430DF3B